MASVLRINLSDGTLVSLMRESDAFYCFAKTVQNDAVIMRQFVNTFQDFVDNSTNVSPTTTWKEAWRLFETFSMTEAKEYVIDAYNDRGEDTIYFKEERDFTSYTLVSSKALGPVRVHDNGHVTNREHLLGPAAYVLYMTSNQTAITS